MALKQPAASSFADCCRARSGVFAVAVLFLLLTHPLSAQPSQLAQPAQPARLIAARVGDWPDRVRLVLESDRPFAAEQRYAERRLELYLSGVEVSSLRQVLSSAAPQRHRLIDRYRLEPRGNGDWILQLDLAAPVDPQLLTLKPQSGFRYRTVLDMKFSEIPVVVVAHPVESDIEPEVVGKPLSAPGPAVPLAPAPPRVMVPTPAPSAAVGLRAVRLGRWTDRTRLVIETEQVLPFGLLSQATGEQLGLRLDGLDAAALDSALQRRLRADDPLIRLAVAKAAEGHARLDLQLSQRVLLRAFNLLPENGYRHRLVLDLVPEPSMPVVVPVTPPVEATVAAPVSEQAIVAAEKPAPVQPDVTAPAGGGMQPQPDLLWLETSLNRQAQRITVLALRDGDNLLLTAADLKRWRLRLPAQPGIEMQGEQWHRLDALGIGFAVDPRRLQMELTAPAALFENAALEVPKRQPPVPVASPLGGFLNYDVSISEADGRVSSAGLFELGAFNAWGSFNSSALWRSLDAAAGRRLLRLDTAFRRDDPARMRTLVVGDTINSSTGWSGAVRFAGLQWRRDFSTQPEFLTLPLVGLSGEAALPSVLEVYVNEALQLRENIAPGPFSIGDIPVVGGQGEVRMVVRDALGREQVISEAFYAAQQLLRRGLHDWSWEVGSIREDYGLASFEYGRNLVSSTHRYGFTDRMTGEAHVQWLGEQWMSGAGAIWQLPGGGLLQTAAAFSDSEQGRGRMYSVGVNRQGRRVSAGFETQHASAGFLRLGMRPDQPLPARQQRAYASTRVWGGGALSLAWTEQDYERREDVAFLSLRFSRNLGRIGFFSLSALHYPESADTALSASLSIALDRLGGQASVNGHRQGGHSRGSVQLQRSLPAGDGWGYQLRMGLGGQAVQQAGVAWQNAYGLWQVEGADGSSGFASRFGLAGGVGRLDGTTFLSRSIRDGFALVRVPGFAGVRVYADNQVVGSTDAEGELVVPHLRAYQRNRLRIEQADLPLGIGVQAVEREVVPFRRSGLRVDFPAARSRDAFFRVVLESGEPLPVGSTLEWPTGRFWPVGYRGEAYVTGLEALSTLRARHNGAHCAFELTVPDSREPLLDLGTVICREVPP